MIFIIGQLENDCITGARKLLTRRVDEEIVATRVKTSIPANYTKASRSYIYLYNGRMHV